MKVSLPLITDLSITAPSTCTPEVLEDLAKAVLLLYQYDGNPIQCCDGVADASARAPEGEPPCLLPTALKVQVFASVMIEMDVSALEVVIAKDSPFKDQYEDWEIRHFEVVVAFAKFDLKKALVLGRATLEKYPGDVFTARAMFVTTFLIGEQQAMKHMFNELVYPHFKSRTTALNPLLPYVQVLAAFAVEEVDTGEKVLAACEASVMDALAQVETLNEEKPLGINYRHAYGVHTLFHISESRHDPDGGVKLSEQINGDLWKPTQHLLVHLWWHVALMHYDSGSTMRAFEIYDQHCFPHVTNDDQYSMSDATAFLSRAFLDGNLRPGDVRLSPLRDMWVLQDTKPQLKFFTFFHFHRRMFLGLEAGMLRLQEGTAEEEVTKHLDFLQKDEAGSVRDAYSLAVPRYCALTRAMGMLQMNPEELKGQEIYSEVSQKLDEGCGGEEARRQWVHMGGSNAQRDILLRLMVYCTGRLSKLGSGELATKLLIESRAIVKQLIERYPLQPHHRLLAQHLD